MCSIGLTLLSTQMAALSVAEPEPAPEPEPEAEPEPAAPAGQYVGEGVCAVVLYDYEVRLPTLPRALSLTLTVRRLPKTTR